MDEQGSSGGSRQLTRSQGLKLGGAVIVVGLLVASVVPYFLTRSAAARNSEGVPIDGQVLEVRAFRPMNTSSQDYDVTYTYEAGGSRRCQSGDAIPAGEPAEVFCADRGRIEINEPTYDAIRERAYASAGDTRPIALRLLEDPARTHPEVTPRTGFFIRMGLLTMAVGAFICWVAWKFAPRVAGGSR